MEKERDWHSETGKMSGSIYCITGLLSHFMSFEWFVYINSPNFKYYPIYVTEKKN